MKIDKSISTGVVSSLLASLVFLYFLDPILKSFAKLLVYFYSQLGTKYIDRVYAQAAHLETQDYSFLLVVSVLMIICTVLLLASILNLRSVLKHSGEQALEEERIEEKKNRPGSKRLAVFFLIFSVLYLVWGAFMVTGNYIQLSLISSFRQHMRIIAPYITDQEGKELISEWSRMQTQAEYKIIYEKLWGIAREHDLKLPENMIYSIFSI